MKGSRMKIPRVVKMQPLRPRVFEKSNISAIIEHLNLEGYVVVKDYLDKEGCQKFTTQFFDYCEAAKLGFDRMNRKTWTTKRLPTEGLGATQFNSGFLGIYHLPIQDDLRFDPNAENLWKALWSSKLGKEVELWTGFDRINFMPPTDNKISKQTKETFLHWDQNYLKNPDFMGLQAVLSITDCDLISGTFTCVPRSHLTAFSTLNPKWAVKDKADMVNVPLTAEIWNDRVALELKAGEICIWDSRLIHGNIPNRAPLNGSFRLATYPRMFPIPLVKREEYGKLRYQIFKDRTIPPGNQRDVFKSGYIRPRYAQMARGMQAYHYYQPRELTERELKMLV